MTLLLSTAEKEFVVPNLLSTYSQNQALLFLMTHPELVIKRLKLFLGSQASKNWTLLALNPGGLPVIKHPFTIEITTVLGFRYQVHFDEQHRDAITIGIANG